MLARGVAGSAEVTCNCCGKPIERRSPRGRLPRYCGVECWPTAYKGANYAKRDARYWRLRRAGYPSKVAMAARDSEEQTVALLNRMSHGQGSA